MNLQNINYVVDATTSRYQNVSYMACMEATSQLFQATKVGINTTKIEY